MNIKEIIFDTLRLMKAAKLRTLLTMLGIIIGISSVIIINSIGKGQTELLKDAFSKMGNNILKIGIDRDYDGSFRFNPNNRFSLEDIKKLNDNPNVEAVAICSWINPITITKPSDYSVDGNIYIRGYNATASHFEISNSKFLAGRNFSQCEENKFLIIDNGLAELLYGSVKNAVGKELDFRILYCGNNSIHRFTVIGVIQNPELDIGKVSKNQRKEFQLYFSAIQSNKIYSRNFDYLFFKLKNNVDTEKVKRQLIDQITALKGTPKEAYSCNMATGGRSKALKTINNQNLYVLLISAISLLVGGIVIMNIMLFTVTERTREIGVRRALGARKIDIIIQFLIESAIMTLIGGILGIVLGCIGTVVAGKFSSVPPVLSFPSIIAAALISILIGIIFGLYPAAKAANLDPVEALRRE